MRSAQSRILLVGAGRMGTRHARVLADHADCELVQIVDPDQTLGRATAELYGAKWTPEIDDLSTVDGVVVAAPTEVHYPLAIDVLRHDTALLVEKPVCPDLAASREVVRVAEKRDVPLMCGLLERYNPAVLTALALLESPMHVRSTRQAPYASRIRTGVAWDLLVHDIDLAMRVLGDVRPSTVQATTGYFHAPSRAEDIVDAVLGFPQGRMATVSASRVDQRRLRTMVVTEMDRVIEADLLCGEVVVHRKNDVVGVARPVTSRSPLESQLDRFLGLVTGTVDAREERGTILPAHQVVDEVLHGVRAAVVA